MQGFAESFGKVPETGCLLVGERGMISAGLWNTDGYLRMKEDKKFRSITKHEAAQSIPETLPRAKGHMAEWVEACRGTGKTFSNFEIGGLVTEIGLTGILPLRLGHRIEWDGETMKVADAPETDRMVKPEYRTKWLV